MIKLNFAFLLISILTLWFGYRIKRSIQLKAEMNISREMLLNGFFMYLLAVLYLTMYPFVFNVPFLAGAKSHYHFDFRLFYHLRYMTNFNLQLLYSVGNILMLVPFGLLVPMLFKFSRRFITMLALGFMCSLTIELTQTFFTMTRRGTFDDLFFNTLGAGIGYVLYSLIRLFSTKIRPLHKLINVHR